VINRFPFVILVFTLMTGGAFSSAKAIAASAPSSAPTPDFTAIPLAPEATAGQAIFMDDFSILQPSWGNRGPDVSVTDGYLVLTPERGKSVMIPNLKYRYRDFDASVDVTPTPALHGLQWAGLVFWGLDATDYYLAEISNRGMVSVMEWKKGKPLLKAEKQGASPGPFAMQTVAITVSARANRVEVSAWGTSVSMSDVSAPKSGGFIGLYAESSKALGWIWRFSKLVVNAPPK
jgi:hypothetical protein